MQNRSHFLGCLVGLALIGCAGRQLPPAASLGDVQAPKGHAQVILHAQVTSPRAVQAAVSPYSATDIERLDVIPFVQTSPGVFQALEASTGLATDSTDPGHLLRVTQTAPAIGIANPIVLDNLQHDTTYRFYARAYDSHGTLISTTDSSSYLQLAVGCDDRPTVGALPCQLIDRVFSATANVTLTASRATWRYSTITTDVFTVTDGVEIELANSAATTSYGVHPDLVSLSNLQSNTLYRVKASALDGANTVLATASVDISVTTDAGPYTSTLAVTIPNTEVVSTLAGGSIAGSTNGTGTNASFNSPWGLVAASSGSLYVADNANHCIREIVVSSRVVSNLVGTPSGDSNTDGNATTARFRGPSGLALDNSSGTLYVADYTANTIRKIVLSTRAVTTLAGTANSATAFLDGTGTSARFYQPVGLALDGSGNLYVADSGNFRIRKIVLSTGVVSTVAGTGTNSSIDGIGTNASLKWPGPLVYRNGFLYFGEGTRLRRMDTTSLAVVTLAGDQSSGLVDDFGAASRFYTIEGLAFNTAGALLISDSSNDVIRRANLTTGLISTFAGHQYGVDSADGSDAAADIINPKGLAIATNGSIYVVESGNGYHIRKIVP